MKSIAAGAIAVSFMIAALFSGEVNASESAEEKLINDFDGTVLFCEFNRSEDRHQVDKKKPSGGAMWFQKDRQHNGKAEMIKGGSEWLYLQRGVEYQSYIVDSCRSQEGRKAFGKPFRGVKGSGNKSGFRSTFQEEDFMVQGEDSIVGKYIELITVKKPAQKACCEIMLHKESKAMTKKHADESALYGRELSFDQN